MRRQEEIRAPSPLPIKILAAASPFAVLLAVLGAPSALRAAEDPALRQVFQKTPIFGNPITLTKAEVAVAEQWPITKVFLFKDLRAYLVLYRSDVTTGKTAAFFHWVAPEAGWQKEFAFGMREIDDAYWVQDPMTANILTRHQAPVPAEILSARQGALTRGYLRQGLERPCLILIYTDGKTFKETEITYPLVEFEAVADGQGFVAFVGPPVMEDEPREDTPLRARPK